jgi:Peptidase family S41
MKSLELNYFAYFKSLAIIASFFLFGCSCAQKSHSTTNNSLYSQNLDLHTEEIYSQEKINEDFQILRKELETNHTGLYTYANKSTMDSVFNKLEASFQSTTAIEFYRKIIDLNKHIRNGHTFINPADEFENKFNKSFLRFPFDVYLDNNVLYVLKNNSSNPAIMEGSIIKTINGEDAVTVFKELCDKMPRDGYNTTFPEKIISTSFNQFYAYLKGIYPTFDLEIITVTGEHEKFEIAGLTGDEMAKNKLNKYHDDGKWWGITGKPVLNLQMKEDVAIMKIQTFSIYYAKKAKQNFKEFFENSFNDIEKSNIKHLIIDMRGNGGGDEMPTIQLFSHLSKQPFTFYESMYAKSNKIQNSKLYSDSGFSMNVLYPLFNLKKNGDVYNIKGIPGLKEMKPAATVFDGNVYILTDGFSFSATGEITSFIKNADRAIFIGEEVGGNANQNISGTTRFLTLPNTKVRIQIPIELFKLNVKGKNTGHGVIPDYYIKPSITDKIKGNDPEMKFTLELIEKNKKS